MEDNLKKFNLEADLECTICLEFSVSPIQSCHNGHIVCGICSDKVKNCGICGEDALFKCGFAERLAQKYVIRLPCKYFESGCKIPIKSTAVKAHLSRCEYRPILCFDIRTSTCNTKSFEMKKFVDHLKSHHKTPPINLNTNGEYRRNWNAKLEDRTVVLPYPVQIFETNSQYFLSHSVLGKTAFCCWMTVLGGQTDAEHFYYTTKLTSPSKNAELTWKFPVLPFHKFNTFEKVVESGHFVSIEFKTIKALMEKSIVENEEQMISLGFKIQTTSAHSI